MKNLAILGVLALAIAPGAGLAQSTMTMGEGIHGYDFLIGSWTCTNSNPGPMTGPASASIVGTAAGAHNAIALRFTGTGLDSSSYISYDPKSNVWSSPAASADGTWAVETTKESGAKVTWSGSGPDPTSGKTVQFRDTFTRPAADTYVDLSELNTGGGWKSIATFTCTKSS
jgi:hypothetical protein